MLKFFLGCLILIFLFNSAGEVFAASQDSQSQKKYQVEVRAKVGRYYLSISGFISPFASIVLNSNNIFLSASVADRNGYFSMSDVQINDGFSNFCLTAVDFYRLGESTTCFRFTPVKKSINLKDIFLPPTLTLSEREVPAFSKVSAFGYTMPGASVIFRLGNGKVLLVRADGQGRYVVNLDKLKAGTYQLSSVASFKGEQSLAPSKPVYFKTLSLWEQILKLVRQLFERILSFIHSIGAEPFWFILPGFILIIILLLRFWPEQLTFFYENKLKSLFFRRRKKKKSKR